MYVLDDSADDSINPSCSQNIKRHNIATYGNSNHLNSPDEKLKSTYYQSKNSTRQCMIITEYLYFKIAYIL